ncbi:MAG TPA: biopolymer transporter ExbD [Acidobacteriota bacterium]|nr:biopolymer transporter ExbD [Acidobacteriota bacterium]
MGAADVGGDRQAKGKKKGLRRPKRRIAIKIDMTPMVDIAFLLLIFYMVSTVFAEPQAMEINLPPSKEEAPTAESKVLTIRVDSLDVIYWSVGKDSPEMVGLEDLASLFEDKVYEIPGLITLVKINKGARYSRMIDILDRIEIVEYRIKQRDADFSYTFSLGPWTRYDTKQLEAIAGQSAGGSEGATP